MIANVQAFAPVNANIQQPVLVDVSNPASTAGAVQCSGVTVREIGSEGVHTSIFTFTNVAFTFRDTEQGGGIKFYTFPKGKIVRLGAGMETTITTTSAIATTLLTGKTGNHGVGSVTQANVTLATVEQDFIQVTAFTTGTTINVAPAAVIAYGVPSVTLLDGSSTPISLFYNAAVVAAGSIDGDATVAVNGTVTVHWIKLG
jgi:hypothetical protein